MAHAARLKSMFVRLGVNMVISNSRETLSVTKSVRELLFDGYSDQLLSWAVKLNTFQKSGPVIDKFALFYKRNGTTDFSALINVGTGNGTNFGKLYQVNGKNQFGDASAGDYFESPLDKTNIKVYIPDFCRELVLEYVEDETVHGIIGYKYIMSNATLAAKGNNILFLITIIIKNLFQIDVQLPKQNVHPQGYLTFPNVLKELLFTYLYLISIKQILITMNKFQG